MANDSQSANTTKTRSGGSTRKRQHSKGGNSAKRPLSASATDPKRRRWISLNNLIELDWDSYIRWTVSKPTLFKYKDKVHIDDHDYEITPWSPLPDEHAALELNAKDRIIIVPIKESEAATEKRSLLVREEGTFDKGSLFMADTELPGDNAPFQRILIIGKEKDGAVGQEPDIIGPVKAVLTLAEPVRTLWPQPPATPPAPIVKSPPPSQQPARASLDEDLLERIDELNILRESRDPKGEDAALLQSKLYGYLSDRDNLTAIPITINQTRFDQRLGHIEAKASHLTGVEAGRITAVTRIGYIRNGKVVRKANVIVNRHSTQNVRLRKLSLSAQTLQVEMTAPQDCAIGELMREAAIQTEALDAFYDWIRIFRTGCPTQIQDLARRLRLPNLKPEDHRRILREANDQHLQIDSLKSDSQITLTLCGEVQSLEVLKDMLETEARRRTAKFYYQQDPADDWSFKRLSDLQEFLPLGINLAMFARDGEQIPRQILGQITFAPDFELPKKFKQAPQS